MKFTIYQGYKGYGAPPGFGAVTVAEFTNVVRSISKMVKDPGSWRSRFPMTAGVEDRETASGLLDLFTMRASEMGWIITDSRIIEDRIGDYYIEVDYVVPEGARPTPEFAPEAVPEKKGPSIGATVLVVGVGVGALATLVYAGATRKKR